MGPGIHLIVVPAAQCHVVCEKGKAAKYVPLKMQGIHVRVTVVQPDARESGSPMFNECAPLKAPFIGALFVPNKCPISLSCSHIMS